MREWHGTLLFYVIVSDANVTMGGKSSDAMLIEACEMEQKVRFQLVRRYAPPGLLSKAKAEKELTLVKTEPVQSCVSGPCRRSSPMARQQMASFPL